MELLIDFEASRVSRFKIGGSSRADLSHSYLYLFIYTYHIYFKLFLIFMMQRLKASILEINV